MEKSLFKRPKKMASFRLDELDLERLKIVSEAIEQSQSEIISVFISAVFHQYCAVVEGEGEPRKKYDIMIDGLDELFKDLKRKINTLTDPAKERKREKAEEDALNPENFLNSSFSSFS